MHQPSTILITGSSGTIGTALVERLLRVGHDVIGVDVHRNHWSKAVDDVTVQADLRDRDALRDLPSRVDLVVHLAANARVQDLVESPARARDNFEMTFNVLEYARKRGVSGVIFSSTREVYGDGKGIVRDEEQTAIDECESPYTASKMGGEAMVDAYARCYDFDAIILRFSNVYGRYDGSDRVVPLFISRAHHGHDLTVYGGKKVLDFTYIDDCIDGISEAIDRFDAAAGMTFNIASGRGTSLGMLAETIIDALQSSSNIRVEESRVGEISRCVADISRARSVLDYNPVSSPLGGLNDTIDWYLERSVIDDLAE